MNCLALIKAISVSWLSSVCLVAQQTALPPRPQLAPKSTTTKVAPTQKNNAAKDKTIAAKPTSKTTTNAKIAAKPASSTNPNTTTAAAPQKTPPTDDKPAKTDKQTAPFVNRDTSLVRVRNLTGSLSPKSVVHSGDGRFFAQNMMYNHTISVFNRDFTLLKTIRDEVKLSDYGIKNTKGNYKGAPVEVAFSHAGHYAWVSNYRMYGDGYSQDLGDNCPTSSRYDNSFLYRINTDSYHIEQVIEVGSVPKYVATTPDDRYVLVSNWCSGDVSIVDIATNKEIKRVPVGSHPRGIVVDAASRYAYIAVMGGSSIAVLNLRDFSVERIRDIGITPRHLCLSPDGRYLYATFNNEGKVGKIDLNTRGLVAKTRSGRAPRSMVLSGDGQYLYVVNYNDGNMSKIAAADLNVLQKIKTPLHPIGITFDDMTNNVWVACYSGSIAVYHDRRLGQISPANTLAAAKRDKTTAQSNHKPAQPNDKTPNTALSTPPSANNNKAAEKMAISTKPIPTQTIPPTIPAAPTKIDMNASDGLFSRVSKAFWSYFDPPAPKTTPPDSGKTYHIIIASFTEQTKYKIPDHIAKAKANGISPNLLTDAQTGRYRLTTSNYAQRTAAEKALPDIRCIYPDAWILLY